MSVSHDEPPHGSLNSSSFEHPTSASDRNFGRSVATTLLGNLFPPLASLASAPILAHVLGVDGRGQMAAAAGSYTLLTTIATLGIPDAVTYAVARNTSLARRLASRGLLITVLIGVIATASAILLSPWLSASNSSTQLLICYAAIGIVPALCLGIVRATASGLQKWKLVASERAVSSGTRLLILAVLAGATELNPTTATLTVAVAPLLGSIAYLPLRRKILSGNPEERRQFAPRLVSYGFRTWLGSVSGIILSRVDQTIVAPLSGTYQLGLYAVAVSVSEIPLVINSAVRDVTFASEASGSSTERLAASARISGAASLVAGLAIAVASPIALPILFGSDFRPALSATWILLVAVVVGTPGSVAGAGLGGRGRPGLRSAALTVACAANVGLLAILTPRYGADGAAIATLAGNLIASNAVILSIVILYDVPFLSFYGIRRSDMRLLKSRLGRALSGAPEGTDR